MTTFLLIRHASHDLLGKAIAGRSPGVRLSPKGRQEAADLAERLASVPLRAVYSSPLERTRETAEPLSARLGLEVRISEAILELDFGEWTGKSLEELRQDPRFGHFNSFRSGTRIPGGERMPEAQARFVGEMHRLAGLHPDEWVALVSHGDPIKSALAYYLGVPLDLFQRIEISPASVSVVELNEWGPRVLCVNGAGERF